ncbi:MAG: hypothetical protein Q9208_007856 [Pyrenodesmia sp. 3 TL-2023]
MSTNVHEVLIGHVSESVARKIQALAEKLRANGESPRVIREIEAIKNTLSARVLVQNGLGGYDELRPDASWKPSLKYRYPRLVLEVAYSESEVHARTKALRFLRGTDGAIQHVLVFKVSQPHRSLKGWVWLSRAVKAAKGSYEATDVIERTVRLLEPSSRILLTIPPKKFIPKNSKMPTLPLKLGYFLRTNTAVPQRLRDTEISIPLLELPNVVAHAVRQDTQDRALKAAFKQNHGPSRQPSPRDGPQKSNFTTWARPRLASTQPILRGPFTRAFRWLAGRR